MAIIDPDGLFGGDRLAALSDKARLYWPWLYTASNGFARLELSPRAIIQRCFGSWSDPMSEEQLRVILSEYADNYLLFVYEARGQQWIQFDTPEKLLKRHKTKRDASSPPPPPEAIQAFDAGYMEWKRSKSFNLHASHKPREIFGENARGIGKGIGKGIGEGEGTRAPDPPPAAAPEPIASAAAPHIPLNAEAETLVQTICMAHPRSQARKQRFDEAPWSHKTAVMEAARDEVTASGCSLMAALEMLLARVERHAEAIPRDQHRYVKDVAQYFALHEYRLEPDEIARMEASNGGSRTQTKTGGTIDALEQARAYTRSRTAQGGDTNSPGEARSPPPGAP